MAVDDAAADIARLGAAAAALDGIEVALGRIDAGTYGTCERCGSPLGDPVLERDPTASTCPGGCGAA